MSVLPKEECDAQPPTNPVKFWSLKTCAEQLAKCDYECEGGPLVMNDAYIWLKQASVVGPEYQPGQGVYFEVTAVVAGQTLSKWAHFYIVGCRMDSGTEDRFWTYELSNDPPGPWHYGTVQYRQIRGDKLKMAVPA